MSSNHISYVKHHATCSDARYAATTTHTHTMPFVYLHTLLHVHTCLEYLPAGVHVYTCTCVVYTCEYTRPVYTYTCIHSPYMYTRVHVYTTIIYVLTIIACLAYPPPFSGGARGRAPHRPKGPWSHTDPRDHGPLGL